MISAGSYELLQQARRQREREAQQQKFRDASKDHEYYEQSVNVGLSRKKFAKSLASKDRDGNRYVQLHAGNRQFDALMASGEIDGATTLLVQVSAKKGRPLPTLTTVARMVEGPMVGVRFQLRKYIGKLRKNRVAVVRRVAA